MTESLGTLTFDPFEPNPRIEYRLRLQTARTWLRSCLDEHEPCAIGQSHHLPTRLVSVDCNDGDVYSHPQARLVNSTEIPADTPYLTLSHCWGSETFLTLTQGNFDQMRQSIPVAQLKPVFQEAMWIARELGFGHIWIDSLCIIQDSPGGSDWLHESATMDRVYGNSTCNLAATGFSNGNQGLFQPIDEGGDMIPPEISLGTIGRYSILCSDDWNRDVKDGPLHKRGWVLQEQLMVQSHSPPGAGGRKVLSGATNTSRNHQAPRILHFTTRQMCWECSCRITTEVFPMDLLRTFQYYIDNSKLSIRMPKIMTGRYANVSISTRRIEGRGGRLP